LRHFRAAGVKTIAASLGLCLWLVLSPQAADAPSSLEEIRRHARYLASDELMGRGVGAPGIDLARDYISEEFKKYGLLPGGDGARYLQRLAVATGARAKEPSGVVLGGGAPLVLGSEWVPLGLSISGSAQGEAVFVGYGITAQDRDHDDYAGIDAKGKIAIVARYEPRSNGRESPGQRATRYSRQATLRAKAANARNHGAAGMIIVDLSPPEEAASELIPMQRTLGQGEAGIVAVQINRAVLEKKLQELGLHLGELKEKIDREGKPFSVALPGLRVSLSVTLERITAQTDNVVGILPGSDPKLKSEYIVVGAHYDHIGLGYFGTRDRSAEGQVHNGADDNASGTALLLELARRMSQKSGRPPRSIVFVAFTGEELGVYGSKHFVTYPPIPLKSARAMLNLDMVGRMRGGRLTVSGIDTAKEFRGLVTEAGAESGIEIRLSSRVGASDHAPFYSKGIPVLHFYTGLHEDYHRPTDDWEKLNVEGMIRVGDLVLTILERIARLKEPLTFVRAPAAQEPSEASPTSPRRAPAP